MQDACAARELIYVSVLSFLMNWKKNYRPALFHVLRGVIFALMLAAAPLIHAATVWNGPLFTYIQPALRPDAGYQPGPDHAGCLADAGRFQGTF